MNFYFFQNFIFLILFFSSYAVREAFNLVAQTYNATDAEFSKRKSTHLTFNC